MTNPIRLALIGAGVYARDSHLPALKALGDTFEVVAIYSRTQAAAEALAAQFPGTVDVFTDATPLLARADIEAVDILLPIEAMPPIVEQALTSGKHVISEKPIAPDVATGQRLIKARRDQVWMVAENWRYEDAFTQAAALLKSGEIGRPMMCHWAYHIPMMPDNKYYQSGWRRAGNFPGGMLMDGGVHHIAAMRMLLGDIVEVSAAVTQMRPDLPPADTVSATLRFASGLIGTYAVTYSVGVPWPPTLTIAGDAGALRVHRGALEIATNSLPVNAGKGVELEFAAFANAIHYGHAHLNTPEQALQDVAVIEAMLRAAETGCKVEIPTFV